MSQIWFDGKIQFKKDKFIVDGTENTVEGEWLNGKPHGICIFENEKERGVMTFTHGKVDGGPCWLEKKGDGTRVSCEYFDEKDPKGLIRMYNNDKDTFNVTSTTNKQPAPGWLKQILYNKGKQGMHLKQFEDDGSIKEAELDENQKPIKGWVWKLKEDGTHDKYKLETVVCKEEGSDEED
jgi:hypothetical protein